MNVNGFFKVFNLISVAMYFEFLYFKWDFVLIINTHLNAKNGLNQTIH